MSELDLNWLERRVNAESPPQLAGHLVAAIGELRLLRSQVSAVREWAGKEIEHAKKAMVNHFDPTSRAMAQQERDTLREVLRLLGEGE